MHYKHRNRMVARALVFGATLLSFAAMPPAYGAAIPWYEDSPQPHGPGGTVLVDHPPSNFGGLASDTLVNEFPGWQRVADDFTLSQAAIINRIVWHGFYDMNIFPVADDIFRIRIYDQRPSDLLPGTVIYEQSFSNVPRSWTGRFILTFGAPRELRYEVDLPLPFALPAATPLWLEIVQDGDINSHFRWEQSSFAPLTGVAFVNPIVGDWTQSFPTPQSNNAFQLIGVVPEPSSCVFVAIAGIALMRRRSRRSN